MDVLKDRQKLLAVFSAFLVAASAVVLSGGCRLFQQGGSVRVFRHQPHAARGVTCDACHFGYATGAEAGMPDHRVCLACHGRSPYREPYPYEREIQSHEPTLAFVAKDRFFDLRFSHAVHFEKEVGCLECHGDLDAAPLSASRSPAPEVCEGCHRERQVGADCSVCHREMRKDVRPPSHQGAAWRRTHGRDVAYALAGGHRERCELCHSRGYCTACHEVEKPQDHSEFFRLRAHGLSAAIDRDRCQVCHRETFCVRCHQETEPRSHFSAVWGGMMSNHCLACHEPVSSSSCSVCHGATPSHALATPIPPPPHPSALSDCRRCHLRPPHADNGMDCTICHK